jgi:hypothetical protein
MADRAPFDPWRAGQGATGAWRTSTWVVMSALGAACGASSSPSDAALYEGPNFYESGQAANAALPVPERAPPTDFLTAVLQDGSVAPACGAGPRETEEAPPSVVGLACPAVSHPAISGFTFAPGGSTSTTSFGADAAFPGGTFFYPSATTGLTSDVTGSDWHLSGTVSRVSGFGLFLSGCRQLDASAYGGIAFRLWGRLDPPGSLVFFVGSAAQQVSSTWLNAHKPDPTDADEPVNLGRCIPLAQRFDSTCREPRIGLPVTETPTLIQVYWRDLVAGCPESAVNAAEITSIAWYFPPSTKDYAVDIHLDDLRFADLDVR